MSPRYTWAFMAAVYAIVPAAGLGTRMGAGPGPMRAPKQFLLLAGVPILVHTLRALAQVPELAGVWVAVRADEQGRLRQLLTDFPEALPPVHPVEGGDTRQGSVARALAAIPCPDDAVVLVHDAVRPLVEPAAILRTIEAARVHGAAILALPATDTIKHVERTARGALVTATVPRENVVQAQTPQAARAELLRRAVAEAEADGFAGTDEASLLERAGFPVAVVAGAPSNLKVTQAADLPLAEWYLQQRKGTPA